MKNIATHLFVTLGVIFLILVILGAYFVVTDPFGIRPLLFGGSASMQGSSVPASSTQENADTGTSTEQGSSGGFELSDAQIDALVSLGIDPAAVPSSISAEQEACFVGVLGEARVEEIRAGAVPGTFEFLKAKSCI